MTGGLAGWEAGAAGAAAGGGDGLGELVRRGRVGAGLTQEELAERSGLGLRTIGDIERGRAARPHRRSLELLSRELGLALPARRGSSLTRPDTQVARTGWCRASFLWRSGTSPAGPVS